MLYTAPRRKSAIVHDFAEILDPTVHVDVDAFDSLSWYLADPHSGNCGGYCGCFSLESSHYFPDGRMKVSDQMDELVVPSLTCVVGPWVVLQCCLVDIPPIYVYKRYRFAYVWTGGLTAQKMCVLS